MKTMTAITLLALCGVLGFAGGCSKQTSAPPQAGKEAKPTDNLAAQADKAAQAAAQEQAEAAATAESAKMELARQQAEAAKLTADKAAADKAGAAQAAADKAAAQKLAQAAAATQEQTRITGMIDSVKNLMGENKNAEALKLLSELSKSKLSPEQTALVDGLKSAVEQQAQQAVLDKAAAQVPSGAGDVLGGMR